MTTSNVPSKIRYQGNGVTLSFAFNGRIFSASDLVVELIDRDTDTLLATWTNPTDYGVTITSPEAATITAVVAPTNTQDLQIRRAVAQSQTLDLPTGTPFPAEKTENALDRTVVMVQDLTEVVSRSIKVPVTYSGETPDVVELLDTITDAAEQTAEDREQTGLDRVQTGLDRIQTGLDRTQTGLDVITTAASASNAFTYSVQAASTFTATSTSSVTVGTGNKTFTVQTNKGFQNGQPIRASSASNVMDGTVFSYNNSNGELIIAVTSTSGSGTLASWNISVIGSPGSSGSGSGTVSPIWRSEAVD